MKNIHFQSLAARLSLWIITLGAIIFIAVLSANYILSRFLLADYVSELAKTKASSTVYEIANKLQTVVTSAESLSAIISNSDLTEKQIHQTIQAFLSTDTGVFGMTVALEPGILNKSLENFSPYYYRKDNTITYSNLADTNYQYKNQRWYTEPKKRNTAAWSEPYLDTGGGNVLMVTYSTPIYLNNNKTFAGIATADIELSWLDKIIKQIKIGDSGYGFIVSKDDIVISHPDTSLNLKKLIDTLGDKVTSTNWQKYIESKTQSSTIYLKVPCRHHDGFCWVAIETLADTGWKIIIVLPEQELISDISSLTIKITAIAVIGLLILLFVIIFITRHLTNPLGRLAESARDIGAGYLDTEIPGPVRDDEIGSLTEDFSSMRNALKLYIAEIQEKTAKQQKLDSEIQIAKDIQMSMIPGAGNVRCKHDQYQLFALLKPARSVGGDLYYYQLSDNQLNFIIGDVSDKGIPAALFMAKTVTLYTRALKEKLTPSQTFTMMNDLLAQNNDACMFVTALCGSIDLKSGDIIMANAGHMDPIIKDQQQTKVREIKGATALGLMEGVSYTDIMLQLARDNCLIMYTDGISEAHNVDDEQYTDERLIKFISDIDSTDSEVIGSKIMNAVEVFAADTEQFDDITLLIIRYD